MGRPKTHPRNYFCILHSFELKLCRMVELRIPNNHNGSFALRDHVTSLLRKMKVT